MRHAWLVDPVAQSVEVYRATPEGWLGVQTHTGAKPLRAEPFDAVEIQLDRIWIPAPEASQ